MKDKVGNVVWICRSVVRNECATPRVADKNESFGADLLTDRFKVGNESLHGVVASLGKLTGQAGASLIEEIDAESILCELAVEGMVCIEGAKTRPPPCTKTIGSGFTGIPAGGSYTLYAM